MSSQPGDAQRDDLFALLSSKSPSERMAAARRLDAPLSEDEQRRVMVRIQAESVPQIKAVLDGLLLSKPVTAGVDARAASGEDDHASGEDLAKLIVHELAPAIGIVSLEASVAIPDFPNSRTSHALDKLTQRVTAVAKIASARPEHADQRAVNLLDAVQAAAATHSNVVIEATPEDSTEEDFIVGTDAGILALLLEAAFNNAIEAQAQIDDAAPVIAEVNATDVSCSISITNRFVGSSIDKAQVLAMGRTTRFGGRGTGMRVVAGAALTLGLDWDFRAIAGVATFTVRFERG